MSLLTVSLRAAPLCTAPSNVTVTNIGLTDATVNWNAVIGITQYRVQYRLAPNGVWTNAGGPTANLTRTINGLTEATNYEARVGSRCSGNTYTYGAPVPFTTFACAAPTNISVTNLTPTTANVNWTLAPGVTDYRVQYRPASGGTWTTVPGGWQPGPSVTLTGLTAATDYEVRVGSRCGPGNILYAPIFTFTSACPVPTGLTASNPQLHSIYS